MLDDRKAKVRAIAKTVNISNDRVHNILHEQLPVKKLFARRVPRSLTLDQKCIRVNCCKKFLRRFITVDETWILRPREQSKQWVASGESATKKAKIIFSIDYGYHLLGFPWHNLYRLLEDG